eukprot:SAG11_NODE_26994_length_338_cov_1.062762_1_plen_73_part_00
MKKLTVQVSPYRPPDESPWLHYTSALPVVWTPTAPQISSRFGQVSEAEELQGKLQEDYEAQAAVLRKVCEVL